LFKRRKPEETIPMPPGTALPAGLPSDPEEAEAGQPDLMADKPDVEADQPDLVLIPPVKVTPPTASDNGLGVPPFRPAPPKETQSMSRPPFPAPPTPPAPPPPPAPPAARQSAPTRPASRDISERRTLVVGRGISVQGTVQDAERLVVEGTVEATMIHATELSIAPGGVFKGEVEVEEAEIAGTIDGTLTARSGLIVRGSGKVLGTARCRRLQVEDGGQISGRVEMLTDQPVSDLAPRQTIESVA
jgi:cytoskeletal protein CcmA (bactofilin family)